MTQPKYRRPLNDTQLAILHELFRFRIGTTDLLAQALQVTNKNYLNRKLMNLHEQGYLGRIFEPSYRLSHRPASFFLSDAGVQALKNLPAHQYSLKVLANIKRLKHPSDQYIAHALGVFDICNRLNAQAGESLKLFTKSQLADFDYFPEPRPDGFIRLKTGNTEQQYLLEYLEGQAPFHVILGKLKSYIKYADEGEWEVTNSLLPPVLLVCDSAPLERRLHKYAPTVLDEADEEVLRFYTTTTPALSEREGRTWTSVQNTDELYKLKEIS